MNIGIIQSVIGGGGGNDRVLFSLLDALKDTDHKVTIYTIGNTRMNFPTIKIKKLFPTKIPIFGLYQKILEPLLANHAKNEDIVIALTGDLFLPHNKHQKMIFYSQNNYSNPSKMNTSKYKHGLWKYYYIPYKYAMNKIFKKIKDYNIQFVASSEHVQSQLKMGLGKDSTVIYPPVNIKEFESDNERRGGIMTVGRYSREKNLEKIVNLMGMLDLSCDKILFGSLTKTNTHYFQEIKKRSEGNNISLFVNKKRDLMIRLLQRSKIFISASDETFGISVVESISAGCIPVVPDSTAHKETVPFKELRVVNNKTDEYTAERIKDILSGKYDYLLPSLKEHIKKFEEKIFQKKFLDLIENG